MHVKYENDQGDLVVNTPKRVFKKRKKKKKDLIIELFYYCGVFMFLFQIEKPQIGSTTN